MWTFERYQKWLARRTTFFIPGNTADAPDAESAGVSPAAASFPPAATTPPQTAGAPAKGTVPGVPPPARDGGPIEIEPVEGGLGEIIKKLK
jgi:hypothetical protein